MRLFVLLSIISYAVSIRPKARHLRPEDVGLLHTDAFEQLSELYKNKKPKNQLEMMMDVSDIMAGYCESDDHECKNLAYESSMKAFHTATHEGFDFEYPDNFHSGLKHSLNNMYDTLETIHQDNLEDVIETLLEITSQMKEIDDAHVLQQTAALSAISIAVESTKLWHTVFYDSKNHPLRRLQGTEWASTIWNLGNGGDIGDSVYMAIIADVNAGFLRSRDIIVSAMGSSSMEGLISVIPAYLIGFTFFAIPASLIVASAIP